MSGYILIDFSDRAVINILSPVSKSLTQGMYNSSLAVGAHTWNINCTDTANNIGNSTTRTLTITEDSGGGGGGEGEQAKNLNRTKII